jgi:hypothetical protein
LGWPGIRVPRRADIIKGAPTSGIVAADDVWKVGDIVAQANRNRQRGNAQLLLIGGGVALALLMLALTVAMVLIFALRSDVAVLEEQARRSTKATKALQEEIASLKEYAATIAASRQPDARPVNIDGVDTASDCVIRPGSKNSVADCMKLGPKE